MNRELLMKARAIIAGIPEAQLDLSNWVERVVLDPEQVQPSCGTVACIAGWLASSKQIPGLSLYCVKPEYDNALLLPWPTDLPIPHIGEGYHAYHQVLRHLAVIFDISGREAEALFSPEGDGEFDSDIYELDEGRDLVDSDKALALARFDYLLADGYVPHD
ncbi:hypothetical protein [Cupriavidus basilensis]|uniref:hypothetical protein n=1 Tax=Cupriavidus basilensis TaxID=68895 RepID=UPI0020A64BF4|nr:hypothetical protein [Cupriavidus basilensis]MCP3017416.1 hypothetical protein [Cupriavidus basilensis]